MDARVVQFMGLVNALLGQQARGFQAQPPQELTRTFGVEPLGPRHGLVEWVEDTAPLYNVYKQHAQHTALVEAWLGAPFKHVLSMLQTQPQKEELDELPSCVLVACMTGTRC